jgi:type IV secretion system protein VirB11
VATIHANSAEAALSRMESLVAEATAAPMQKVIAEAVHVIVSIAKTAQGRKVQDVLRVEGYDQHRYRLQSILKEPFA